MRSAKRQKRNSSPQPKALSGRNVALAVVALAALTFIIYFNAIGNGFVWDDHQQIVLNPELRPATPLSDIFTSDIRFAHQDLGVQNHTYRPLQMLTYRMVAATFGFGPAPFHLCNIAFAMACVLEAFAVFLLLTEDLFLAFAASALFAVYPLHTEAVDWIAASPDLGCTLFVLLAFALFLVGGRIQLKPGRNKTHLPTWLPPVFSIVAYAISLLWKETAVVFPVLIVAYVLIVEKPNGEKTSTDRLRAALKTSAAYWVVLVAYLLLRLRVLGGLATGQRVWDLSPVQFALTAAHLMLSYWQKLALPFQLNAYYLFSPIRSLSDPRAIATIVLVPVAIAALVYLVRRARLPAFAALWVFLTLLPAMNLYALGRNAFAERYLYLPSIGFCLLLALFAAFLIRRTPLRFRKPAAILLLVAVVSGFAVETIRRNPDWKDDRTLFAETLLHSPDAPFVNNMVAIGESDASPGSLTAERTFQRAVVLAKQQIPTDRLDLVTAYQGLASLYADRADNQRALQALTDAREIDPSNPETDAEEGLILVRTGRWSEAEPLLKKTLAAHPENENALSSLGLLTWQYHNDRNKAAELFLQALAAHPEPDQFGASLRNNLGSVYGELGDFNSAAEQFRHAIEIAPENAEYHTNLANVFGAAKRYDEARAEAEIALRIDPANPQARAVLENLK
jgi:protein O-mannosyl-transferase